MTEIEKLFVLAEESPHAFLETLDEAVMELALVEARNTLEVVNRGFFDASVKQLKERGIYGQITRDLRKLHSNAWGGW